MITLGWVDLTLNETERVKKHFLKLFLNNVYNEQ